ncbi:ABC transporter permease [Pseudoalteromonas sp. S16_S37]|uniref:ABC transporter permease n=1 Tax=Pseudoalteromonas sp. S16_S37 TaxID=2720228 RepID=UPI00168032D5|nr:ABC transporter permease [Pseudoalteromonas sp. S16_S37]MBD1581815.1 FtsX-like permease family protein [Pseudoalteromonas sp. S16_S37]
MNYWLKELQVALYSLSKRPSFAAVVILTLSITLGAFITMVTLNYTVLLKPLPYPQQERLFVVEGERYDNGKFLGAGVHSYAGAVDAYKNNDKFSQSALLHYEELQVSNLAGIPKVFTTFTTSELFNLLGAQMAVGRYFDKNEGLDTNVPVAVISYDLWQKDFNGRADILAQKIEIGQVGYKIIGVLSEQFVEPALHMQGRQTQIWLPFDFNSRDEQTRRNWIAGFFELKLVGKLATGVTPAQAQQYLSARINERFVQEAKAFPWGQNVSTKAKLKTFEEVIIGDSRSTSLMMLGAVFALLLIACANISNLFLSRAAEKQRQYAIQATLGAQKHHIFRGIFIESFILTLTATVIGLVLSHFSFSFIRKYADGHLPRLEELSINYIVVLFSIFISFLIASVFGFIISNLIDYKALNNVLRVSGKGSGLQISAKTRSVLIISQVALAGVLLTINFSFFKSSLQVIEQPSGFKTENIYWVSVDSSGQQFNRDERIAFIDHLTSELDNMSGVNKVSNAIYPPLITNNWTSILTKDAARAGEKVLPNVNLVDEKYLSTFDIPLVMGRDFKAEEIRNSEKVMLVNETVANSFGGAESVLGKNLYWDDKEDPYKVIGIVKDVYVPRAGEVPQMFTGRTSSLSFMISVSPNANLSKIELNKMLRQINRNLRVGEYINVEQAYRSLLSRDIAIATITSILSLLTLLLAGMGIYGVLSYSVNLRTYELGVRMALGGSPKILSKLVVFDCSKPVVLGLIVSVSFIFGLYFLANGYYELEVAFSYLALILAFFSILLVSLVSCFIPMSKVVYNKPIRALK